MDFKWGIPFGGSIARGAESFFHPERGYEEAEKEARRAWGESQGYERPFWQQGVDQYGRLVNAEDKLLEPSQLLADWMNKYQMSPYAEKSMENARESGLNAASSQGLLGSSAATQNIQQSSSDIMNKDRQEYLRDLMQKYMTGIGIGQDIYGTGSKISANLGQGARDTGRDIAGARYGAYNAPGEMFGNLLNTAANLGINYATGGLNGAASGAAGRGSRFANAAFQ